MKCTSLEALALAGALLSGGIAHAALIENFDFNDETTTALNATPNSVNPGHPWIHDMDHAATIQVIGGSGSLNIVKNNTDFVTEGMAFDDVSSGKSWMVATFANWTLLGEAPDGNNREEIRFGFMATEDTTPPPSSTTLAEMMLARGTNDGPLQVSGTALGAAGTSIAPVDIGFVQTDPFSMVMMIDQDVDEYKLWYKDGADPYTLVGIGDLEPSRDALVIRFTVNNFWGDVAGEQANLDRFYISDMAPEGLPEPTALALSLLAALAGSIVRVRAI